MNLEFHIDLNSIRNQYFYLNEILKKINNLLSESKKQLISLARAVYADADIYMLDDPLNALDHDEENRIFDNVISKTGILFDKVIYLVF